MMNFLLLVGLSLFAFTAQADAKRDAPKGLYYDMGEDWVQKIESGQDAIDWDQVGYGNGLCFSGNPYKIAHDYFSVGDVYEIEYMGEVEVTRVYVKNYEIRVSYRSAVDGKLRLAIGQCPKDLELP